MPKQRQIPRLFDRRLADGRTAYDWKPSATLRKAGYVNVELGTDFATAAARAIELNREVADRRAGVAALPAPGRALPRIVRWTELAARYRASPAFTDLKPKTRLNYDTRIGQLTRWALDGTLPVRDIEPAMATDLYETLAPVSRFRAADTIRVLRLMLAWAVRQGIVATNAAANLRMVAPPARTTRMDDDVRAAIVAAAGGLGLDDIALAVPLAFWLLQREGDMLGFGRLSWRQVDVRAACIAPEHAARLVDPLGRIWSFRLRQAKTGAQVDAVVPPFLVDAIATRLKQSNTGFLFYHPDGSDAACPDAYFRKRFRWARDAAACVAIGDGDMALAERIAGVQFRDLRRTGMTFYGHSGAKLNWITALSGHAVLGRKSILDVYMPPDTASAAAAVATGLAALEAAQAREVG